MERAYENAYKYNIYNYRSQTPIHPFESRPDRVNVNNIF